MWHPIPARPGWAELGWESVVFLLLLLLSFLHPAKL